MQWKTQEYNNGYLVDMGNGKVMGGLDKGTAELITNAVNYWNKILYPEPILTLVGLKGKIQKDEIPNALVSKPNLKIISE